MIFLPGEPPGLNGVDLEPVWELLILPGRGWG
jgi:hypothetical protein